MNRNLIVLTAVISLVILMGIFFSYQNKNFELKNNLESISLNQKFRNWKEIEIKIGDKNYKIFVTENETDRKNGLAVFEDIKEDEGMVFEFPQEDYHSFWMRGMKFDIDIIFLDKEKKVIQIYENVKKDTYKNDYDYKSFSSKLKSKSVIELKSGQVKKNGLKIGDMISY